MGDQSNVGIPKYQRYQNGTASRGVRPATGVDMALGTNGYQVGHPTIIIQRNSVTVTPSEMAKKCYWKQMAYTL